jgi:hypothetical protein
MKDFRIEGYQNARRENLPIAFAKCWNLPVVKTKIPRSCERGILFMRCRFDYRITSLSTSVVRSPFTICT